jgi:hypothetical protein
MIALKQVPVEQSSQVAAYGFDPVQQVLRVQYRSGKAYDYKQVTAEDHAKLEAAPSLGKHLNAHIKPHFDFELVTDEDGETKIVTKDGAEIDTAKPWQLPAEV